MNCRYRSALKVTGGVTIIAHGNTMCLNGPLIFQQREGEFRLADIIVACRQQSGTERPRIGHLGDFEFDVVTASVKGIDLSFDSRRIGRIER